MDKSKVFHILLFFIFLIFCFGLHFLRTYTDYVDINWVKEFSIPNNLEKSDKYASLKKDILDRPIFLGPDSYYWVLYSTDMVRDHSWRTRHTNYDNVPFGREVAWHSGYMWFLVGLGAFDSMFSERNIIDGIEHMAGWSNPIILSFFLLILSVVLARKISYGIGAALCLLTLFTYCIHFNAAYGRVDHHTLHEMLFLSQFISILLPGLGYIYPVHNEKEYFYQIDDFEVQDVTKRNSARRYYIVAGIFGALGMWVGATQQSVLIALIGVGGGIAVVISKLINKKNYLQQYPELWRWWGYSGAIVSLLLYLVEYFPDNMGMRLEVNHPLYALSWLCGSEILYRITLLTNDDKKGNSSKSLMTVLFFSLVLFVILPCSVMFGPDSWHAFNNQYVNKIHLFINEFKTPYNNNLLAFSPLLSRYGLLPLSVILALVVLILPKIHWRFKFITLQILIPSLLLVVLFLIQTRWDGLASIALICLTLTVSSAVRARLSNTTVIKTAIGCLMLLYIIPGNYLILKNQYSFEQQERALSSRLQTKDQALWAREIAINLYLSEPDQEIRVIGDNNYAPFLAFWGVAKSVGSLYWPNGEGLRDWANFYADSGVSEAEAIAKKRGITHVFISFKEFSHSMQAIMMKHGVGSRELLKESFGYKLAKNPENRPGWLKPFPMFSDLVTRQIGTVIFQVDPKRFEQ